MDARTVSELTRIDEDLRRGALADAERRVLALHRRLPMDARVAYQLGCVRLAQGRPGEAAQAWRQALATKPDWVHPVVALANASKALGDLAECLRYCEMAARMAPREPQVRYNLGCVLRDMRRYQDALQVVDDVLRLDPRSLPGLILRMDVLFRLRRMAEAEAAAERVLAVDPESASALEVLPRLYRARGALDPAAAADARLEAMAARGVVVSPLTAAFSTDDPGVLAAFARAGVVARITLRPPPPAVERERLTVAYLSPDLRTHPVAQMLLDILAAHDRTRVRVVTASLIPDDDSPEGIAIRSLADVHLPLGDLAAQAVAERLRGEGVDVLVDLFGCTDQARPAVLHARAAPVQVLWLGCPVSTGARWYDAWIVDGVSAPEGYEAHTSEPLLRLPGCFHPVTAGRVAPDPSLTRSQAGLPDGVPVLAALHRSAKLSAGMFDAWVRIAASHPAAVLWLGVGDGIAREALRARVRGLGLDPARMVFADREPDRSRYLARWRLADLALDCFPYGGHSTVAEALAIGCPVVTRCGRSLPSRLATSMLRSLGLADYTAEDLAGYERLATGLLRDAVAMTAARQRFSAAAMGLAEDANRGLTRSLEAAYASLHRAALQRR